VPAVAAGGGIGEAPLAATAHSATHARTAPTQRGRASGVAVAAATILYRRNHGGHADGGSDKGGEWSVLPVAGRGDDEGDMSRAGGEVCAMGGDAMAAATTAAAASAASGPRC